MKYSCECILVVLLWCSLSVGAATTTIHVAPNGNDGWSGALAAPNAGGTDGPKATMAGAREGVRARGKDSPGARVLIQQGEYFITEAITFGPEDGGTAGAPIVYEAAPGAEVVIHGGRRIEGWRSEGKFWVADIPEVASGDWRFSQLWVNGVRCTPARTPNGKNGAGDFPEGDELFYAAGPVMEKKADGDEATRSATAFRYREGDLRDWDSLEEAIVVVYHSWETALMRPKAIDTEKQTIAFTGGTNWGFGRWRADQRYHIEHLFEGLDQPGEWFLNRTEGRLYYLPREGEDMTKANVVAPVAKQLLRIEGDPKAASFVEYLHFKGLKFHYTEFTVKPEGHSDSQAAHSVPAAVEAVGARHVVFEDCEVGHVGGYGLWFRSGSQDNQLLRSEIHDLGAGGVRIGEGGSPATAAEAVEGNVVDNCFIHDGGRVFRGGVGVWIGRSSYNRLSHNEICDFRYTGISVGWSWGYADTTAHHNIIEYNRVHHIALGQLSDTGGIYCLGDSPGTVIRNNVFHDVISNARVSGGWGIYFDEGSTGILAENNLVYNTRTGSLHQHYGKDNRVINNILAFSHNGQLVRSREEAHNSFFVQRNIVYFNNNQLLGSTWRNGNFQLDSNIYWSTARAVAESGGLDFSGRSLAEWQAEGHDRFSIVADPLFENAEAGDFRLKADSPAFRLGFEPFDYTRAGLYGDAEWVQNPRKITRPAFSPPPVAAPRRIAEDFEALPLDTTAPGAHSNEEGAGTVRVSDMEASSGTQSLRFSDAPGLKVSYNPHMYYVPALRYGTARGSFAIRFGEGAEFYHEWRDNRSPYQTGPSIWYRDGALTANGERIGEVPADTWVTISIACALGKEGDGTYDLTVTIPGEEPVERAGLSCGSPDFRSLDWFGFVSNSTEAVAVYVDDVHIATD